MSRQITTSIAVRPFGQDPLERDHAPYPTHGLRTLEVKGYDVPVVGVNEPTVPYMVSFSDHQITEKIHYIRGQKVMLDRDLAELYGVPVKRLKEQVRRNSERFPQDFMFELTLEEAESSRSQFATLKRGENLKYLPYAFTEHGIFMLANVLRSEQAIAVSIPHHPGLHPHARDAPLAQRPPPEDRATRSQGDRTRPEHC